MLFDVVIAGAGPAGAVAARVLSMAGRRVLLVDDVPEGRRKIGESLPGAARPLLRDLGLLSLVENGPHLPSYGNVSAWGSSALAATDFIRDPHGPGWHLDRASFDASLREEAGAAGAELRRAKVRSATAGGNGWCVALGRGEIEARFLIDATGRPAALARSLGARRRRDDSLVALYAWAEPAAGDHDTRTLVESAPEGWWYTARLPDGGRVVALHVDGERAAEILHGPEGWGERLAKTMHVAAVLEGANFIGEPRGAEACGACLEPLADRGWLAAGDAAISFDPLSSQGILNALYTGMRAAQALDRALGGDRASIEAYVSRLGAIRRSYLRHRDLFYQLERRWLGSPFWHRRRSVEGRGVGESRS